MKIKELIVSFIAIAIVLGSCSKSAIQGAKIKTQEDSLAYALGIANYNMFMTDSLEVDAFIFAKGMLDGKSGKPMMSDEVARSFINSYFMERETSKAALEAEKNKVQYKDYITENEAFLAKNKEREGVTTTASGLQYEVIKMGTGAKPGAESTVKVHYTGTLIDGTKFDSSVDRGEPAEFPVSGVITGWTEALQLMPVGSKFKIWLPETLAYGSSAAGELIKPYSTLVFEVELLEIVK